LAKRRPSQNHSPTLAASERIVRSIHVEQIVFEQRFVGQGLLDETISIARQKPVDALSGQALNFFDVVASQPSSGIQWSTAF
jgi:hypothetical protein